ncbi:putative cation chloride [Diplodia seriata]|uniref:Putative cation chloride n=1 Tax=Diplodia seriata TaxID=420778 RepID=A0A0G2E5B8_9PEZI|nr:putative cation chloride [Diplodia seriata]
MPVPRTELAADEGPGPSIMFAEPLSPEELRERRLGASIYTRSGSPQIAAPPQSSPAKPDESASVPTPVPGSPSAASPVSQASGFPLQQSVPLSFNDLPCRAQHLILNELIRRESGKDQRTAVIFTTLPSPVEGTCEDEHASVSNSMTVTTNL